jgi:AcrR family transcriptional regulator
VKKDASTRDDRIRKGSRHRREQEKEELRQTILKVAGDLFLEQGYDHFSMRRVAEEIGYSVATLYLYFRDKDALLFAIVDEGFTIFAQQLEAEAIKSNDPWTRIGNLAQVYIDFGLRHPVYYQLMFLWRVDYLTQARPGEKQIRLEAFSVLEQAVQIAMDEKAMLPGDAHVYSDTLWAIMHGIVSLAITMPNFDEERIQKLTESARAMTRKALTL